MERLTLINERLKCDNPTCDYIDETVRFDRLSDYINKPCPQCGENLLTYKDFLNAQIAMKSVNAFNSIPEEDMKEIMNAIRENKIESIDLGKNPHLYINTHDGIKVSIKSENPT